MTRHTAITLLSTLILTATACTEDRPHGSIVAAEPRDGSALTVSIAGPRFVFGGGFYTWDAVVRGGAGEETTYEWSVNGSGRPVELLGANDPTLMLTLDDYVEGQIEISLVVRSGDEQALATQMIGLCPQRHAVDWCFPDDLLERR